MLVLVLEPSFGYLAGAGTQFDKTSKLLGVSVCFYNPFPLEKASIGDIAFFFFFLTSFLLFLNFRDVEEARTHWTESHLLHLLTRCRLA